ncbi:MAG: HAMP domain-containing histidine kinase [Clostridiales bacterium]|nr:HAMP domain-containing histidine kinase [Clostridiales bacterium]
MTYRKHMIIAIILIVFFSIFFNAIVSGRTLDLYFKGYVEEQYQKTIDEVIDYSKNILDGDIDNFIQASIELQNHLEEMIVGISIFDKNQNNIISVSEDRMLSHPNMMNRYDFIEERYYEINGDEGLMGYVVVERIKASTDSESAMLFQLFLIRTIAFSGMMTLIISIIVILVFSKRLTKDLSNTALFAEKIDTDEFYRIKRSKIKEVQSIQKSLINLSTKLKTKEQIRKEKADKLAHEAKTPLTILKSNMEGVLDDVIDVNKKRVEIWINEVNRLAELVENIASIVDYQEEAIKLDKNKISVNEMIEKISKSMELQFEKKNILFEIQLLNEDIIINSDENLIAQSIYNLLSNAFKYSYEDSAVMLKVEKSDSEIKFNVIDEGIGIDKNEIENIFDAYFRGNNHDKIDGKGMGLNIVKMNTEVLGGRVEVKSNDNKGMTFTIVIPV